MTELLRRLVAWLGLSWQPRQAQHPLRESLSVIGASSLRYPPLPAHRSPYCVDTFIDGTSTTAVRPYLVAHEQRQRCRETNCATATSPAAGPYQPDGAEAA